MFSLTLFLFGFAAANSLALSSDGNATIMQDSKASLAQALPATSLAEDQALSQGQKEIVKKFMDYCVTRECNQEDIKAVVDAAKIVVADFDWLAEDVKQYCTDVRVGYPWTEEHFLFLFLEKDHAAVITAMNDFEVPSMPDTVQMPENEDATSHSQHQKDIVKQFVDYYISDDSPFRDNPVPRDLNEAFQNFDQNFDEVVNAANVVVDNNVGSKFRISYVHERRTQRDYSWDNFADYVLDEFFNKEQLAKVVKEMGKHLVVAEFFDYFNQDEEILQLNFREVIEAANIPQFDLDQILETKSLSTFPHADRARVIEEMRKHLATAKKDWMMTLIMNIAIIAGVVFVVVVGFYYLIKKATKVSKQFKEGPGFYLFGFGVIVACEALLWGGLVVIAEFAEFVVPPQHRNIVYFSAAILNFLLPIFVLILWCLTSTKAGNAMRN